MLMHFLVVSPAGTVSRAPKIRALEIIEELEKTRRNIYSGGIGYLSADGNLDSCIALRTAVIKKRYNICAIRSRDCC